MGFVTVVHTSERRITRALYDHIIACMRVSTRCVSELGVRGDSLFCSCRLGFFQWDIFTHDTFQWIRFSIF